MLWRDDAIPKLCPVRHLLAFLFLSGYRSGCLYPSRDQLMDSKIDGNYTAHLTYAVYQDKFKSICHKLLNRKGPFGTHTNRKTAYLLAIWGKGAEADVMASGRHKTVKNSQTYRRDAEFLLTLAQSNNHSLGGVVSKWKPGK
jgi:hypothetical protein